MMPEPRGERDLVGRFQQLRVIDRAIASATEGRGQVLLVGGEPGIGKTRLARAAVERAREAGVRTAWAAAWPGDGAPPLWPWAELLRQLTGREIDLERDRPSSPDAAAAARFHQFESVGRAIRDACSTSAVLLVLDDLHWADTASVRLLDFLAASLADCALVIVATYRPAEIARSELTTLAHIGTTVPMPGLDTDAVHEVLSADLGTSVSAEVAATIRDRTGGNPLFVHELAGLMVLAGRTDVAPASVPDAVTAVIQRRLAFMTEASMAALHGAAVLGQDFTRVDVAELLDLPIDDVDRALDPALRHGLLVGGPRVAFAHDLIRQVVLDTTSTSRRASLHRRAAETLSVRVALDPSLHPAIANHLTQAGPESAGRASWHWEQAGQRARDLLAFEEAAACFRRAREVTKLEPAARGSPPGQRGQRPLARRRPSRSPGALLRVRCRRARQPARRSAR